MKEKKGKIEINKEGKKERKKKKKKKRMNEGERRTRKRRSLQVFIKASIQPLQENILTALEEYHYAY